MDRVFPLHFSFSDGMSTPSLLPSCRVPSVFFESHAVEVSIEEVDADACESRLVDSFSVPALPVDPTELFYNKPGPFHDIVNPEASFDIVYLGAWYSREDHEPVSLLQLRLGSDQRPGSNRAAAGQRPRGSNRAAAGQQPGNDRAALLFQSCGTSVWGGRGDSIDYEAIIPVINTSPRIEMKTDMHTFVYDRDSTTVVNENQRSATNELAEFTTSSLATTSTCTLITCSSTCTPTTCKPSRLPSTRSSISNCDYLVTIDLYLRLRAVPAVPASNVAFATTFNAKFVNAVTPPQGPRTPRNHAQALALPESPSWKIATDNEMTSIKEPNVLAYGQLPRGAKVINLDNTIEKFKLSSSRLIFYLPLKMNIEHMDLHTAYLQSKLAGDYDDIGFRLPTGPESRSGDMYDKLLQRPLHDVRQAGRGWHFTSHEFILNQDPHWKQSPDEDKLHHATDLAVNLFCVDLVPSDNHLSNCSDDKFLDKIVTNTQRRFDIDLKDTCTNDTLQMLVEYKIDTFETHQHRQIENVIEELDEDAKSKTADSPIVTITVSLPAGRHHTITNTELRGYCSTTNTFLWTTSGVIFVVAYYTSSWIALWLTFGTIFVVAYLMRLSKHATKTHWDNLIGALRCRKTIIEPLSDIKLTNNISNQQATVDIIADSTWACDVARKMDIFVFFIYIKNI
jgi:hypothetical protein